MKKTILLNLLFFLLFIFLIESISRILNLANLTGTSSSLITYKEDFYANTPNNEGTSFGKKTYTDKYGFRVPANNFVYKKNEKSILFVGDSQTFGIGVDEPKTFIGLIRKNYENFDVYNSSVIGHELKNHLLTIQRNKELHNLREIIIFLNTSDIFPASSILKVNNDINEENNSNIFNKMKNYSYTNKINVFLRSKSVFYMWAKGIATDPSKRFFDYSYAMYLEEKNINLLEEDFVKLKKLTQDDRLSIKIIFLPHEYQTRVNNCTESYLIPQISVKKILKKINIPLIDLTQSFCDNENPKKLFLKYDPAHLSERGHSFVFSLIKQNGLLVQ